MCFLKVLLRNNKAVVPLNITVLAENNSCGHPMTNLDKLSNLHVDFYSLKRYF